MSLSKASVLVTDHALARYRERVAAYGDAKAPEVVAAVRRARVCDVAELPPTESPLFPRRGRTYAVGGGFVFVMQADGPRAFRLITVLPVRGGAA